MKNYIEQIALQNKEKDINKIEEAINTAYVFLHFGNDIANSAMIDAKEVIIKYNLNKKECKQYLNKAFKEYSNFENELEYLDLSTYYNLLACADKLQDYISDDVKKLIISFRNYLIKFKIDEKAANLLSHIYVTKFLLERSVKIYDEYFKKVNENIGYDISSYMRTFKLNGVFKWWNEVSNYITQKFDNSDLDIKFNDDYRSRLTINRINTKLSDFHKLNNLIKKGLKDNNYNS